MEFFSGRYFPVFGLITGKCGPEKTPYLDTFHAVVHLAEEYDLALNVSQIDSETPNNNSQDHMLVLRNLHVSYPNNIIISHLNIKSVCNKFEMLTAQKMKES